MAHLDETAELSPDDREELGELHATAAALLVGVDAALRGITVEDQIATVWSTEPGRRPPT